MPPAPSSLTITQEHHVHSAVRATLKYASFSGLNSLEAHYCATAVSELANNLFFHASAGGIIQLRSLEEQGRRGVEIIAEDEGPGIANVAQALEDGFSTNGGLGAGLSGVTRLMDECHIDSTVGKGTRIVAKKWKRGTLL